VSAVGQILETGVYLPAFNFLVFSLYLFIVMPSCLVFGTILVGVVRCCIFTSSPFFSCSS
jgi:hypothetical protein